MNIGQMHIWFRQYAQQMGMQNVRAILPEQIDMMINTAISDTINTLIQTNIGITNDRVVTNNSKIGQINALRTLYRVKETLFYLSNDASRPNGAPKAEIYTNPDDDERSTNPNSGQVTQGDSGYFDASAALKGLIADNVTSDDGLALFIVDAAVQYKKNYGVSNNVNKNFGYTKWYPIAIVEDAYLADALQDYSLRPTFRQPIGNLFVSHTENSSTPVYSHKFDIWFGEKDVDNIQLTNYPTVHKIRVSYISKPAKVKYASDLGNDNVNCDLPESMHVDILKHAVDLYRVSVNGNLYANQQAEQNQQREIARNNARPTNEGYQS